MADTPGNTPVPPEKPQTQENPPAEAVAAGTPAAPQKNVTQGRLAALFRYLWERKKKIILITSSLAVAGIAAMVIGAFISWQGKKQTVISILTVLESELKGELSERDKKLIEIYDRNQVLIGEIRRPGQRDIRADNLKDHNAIVWALLASEDRNFYSHGGVQFKSIFRALHTMLTGGDTQGGSTLTQQLAKLILSEAENAEAGQGGDTTKIRKRNVFNKLSEFFCTWFLESRYDKATILAIYLNKVYLGMNSVGFEDASRRYFGVSAHELTPAEAAMLVGIIPAPSLYNPSASMKTALGRQQLVLKLMSAHPYVIKSSEKLDTERQARSFREKHALQERKIGQNTIYASKIGKYNYARNFRLNRAPDFLNEVEKFLNKHYTSAELKSKVLRIDTSLDIRNQEAAARLLNARVSQVKADLLKEREKLLAKNNKQEAEIVQAIEEGINGSYVGLNPENMYVESVVGGYEYRSGSPINRAFSMYRQPGSTIKALVYALAFEKKLIHPSSIVEDKAINIGGYQPKNWYKGYKGKVTARHAFALSMNTVPVQLLHQIGINKFVDTMQMILGLNSEEMAIRIGDRKNLAMALGAIELSPLELAKIYGTIASGGLSIDPVTVLKVTDFDGTELYKADLEKPRQRILDPIACAMVLNLMQAVISAEGTMPLKYKEIDGISGGKTGTVQSPAAAKAKWSGRTGIRDTWFVGALPGQISVIWVGHERGAPFTGSGSGTAGTVWQDFSKDYVGHHPESKRLLPPLESGFVQVDICGEIGLLLQSYPCKHPVKAQVYYSENQGELSRRTEEYLAKVTANTGGLIVGSRDGSAPQSAPVPSVDKSEAKNAGAVELEENAQSFDVFN
ncbi:MAG: transglycosylase domain-containing protein [Turneriella sp.]